MPKSNRKRVIRLNNRDLYVKLKGFHLVKDVKDATDVSRLSKRELNKYLLVIRDLFPEDISVINVLVITDWNEKGNISYNPFGKINIHRVSAFITNFIFGTLVLSSITLIILVLHEIFGG